jgi:hypothetical protein
MIHTIDMASLIIGVGIASIAWFIITLVSQNQIIKDAREMMDKDYENYTAPKYRTEE